MDIQQIVQIGGFIILLGGLVYNFAYTKGKSETVETNLNTKIDQHIADNERSHSTIDGKFQWLRDWKENHERDASDIRLDLQKQIGKLESGLQVHDSQYNEILRLIANMSESVSKKIDRLENSIKESRK